MYGILLKGVFVVLKSYCIDGVQILPNHWAINQEFMGQYWDTGNAEIFTPERDIRHDIELFRSTDLW